jgi:hypothetical protein
MMSVLLAVLVVLVVLGGYTAFALTKSTVLRTEIVIDAGPDEVWAVLTDRDAYPEWNPFIVSSTGDLVVGRTISNLLKDVDGKENAFTPEVLAVEPGKELRWLGKLGLSGVFDGEHAFRIEEIAPGRVRFIQQERFRGVAVPFMAGWLRTKIEPQFRAMNEALARRASVAS